MLVLAPVIGTHARAVSKDTLSVFFEKDLARIDTALDSNKETVDSISRIISTYGHTADFRMSVKGLTSPEGTSAFNQWLSHRRVEAFVEYMKNRTGIALSAPALDTVSLGVDWDGLAVSIEKAQPFDGAAEALSIVRNTPVWVVEDGIVTGGRLKSLKDLQGGKVYGYLMDNIFPQLRRAEVILEYSILAPVESVPVIVSDITFYKSFQSPRPLPERIPYYRLALKTNLLADLILMPSLEMEYLINPEWSVAAHGAVAWWSIRPQHRYYQIATIYPEARWWFSTREPWHGHYLGLFAGGTWYDLENGGRGYKGEGGFVGLSYGYMMPVGKRLSMEFGIGLGYLYTEYEEYVPLPYMGGTHYVYQQTSQMHYLGPLKAKVALVWRFGDWGHYDNKKGGVR